MPREPTHLDKGKKHWLVEGHRNQELQCAVEVGIQPGRSNCLLDERPQGKHQTHAQKVDGDADSVVEGAIDGGGIEDGEDEPL